MFDLSAPYSAQLPQGVSDRQALLPMAPKMEAAIHFGGKTGEFLLPANVCAVGR